MEGRLKQFIALVDAGSFVRAARELHISQPALSVAIAKLERELHAPLLLRGVRPLTLTAAGSLAYEAGKDMSKVAGNLRTQLSELAGQQVAVSVGMIDSVADALLGSPQSITDLEQQALLSLAVDNSRNLVRATADGKLDLAFVATQEVPLALNVEHIGTEPLVLVCHPAQFASLDDSLKSAMLPRFISYDQASTTHRLVADALKYKGVVADTTLYSTSPAVMLQLVLLQKGVSVLPYLQVRELLTAGKLKMLAGPELLVERRIYAIRRRGVVLPKALQHMAIQVGKLLTLIHTDANAARGSLQHQYGNKSICTNL